MLSGLLFIAPIFDLQVILFSLFFVVLLLLVFGDAILFFRIAFALSYFRLLVIFPSPPRLRIYRNFISEERVCQNFQNAGTPLHVLVQNPGNQIPGAIAEKGREDDFVFEDVVVGNILAVAGKGSLPGQQEEHQDAYAPNVNAKVVAHLGENFRRDVIGSSANGVSLTARLHRQPEVGDLHHVFFEQHIVRLDIPVDDAVIVEVLNSAENLQHQASHLCFFENLVFVLENPL